MCLDAISPCIGNLLTNVNSFSNLDVKGLFDSHTIYTVRPVHKDLHSKQAGWTDVEMNLTLPSKSLMFS